MKAIQEPLSRLKAWSDALLSRRLLLNAIKPGKVCFFRLSPSILKPTAILTLYRDSKAYLFMFPSEQPQKTPVSPVPRPLRTGEEQLAAEEIILHLTYELKRGLLSTSSQCTRSIFVPLDHMHVRKAGSSESSTRSRELTVARLAVRQKSKEM